jgi:hypothetical protein
MATQFNPAEVLFALLDQLPQNSPLVGSLAAQKLRMPLTSTDGRALTWEKFLTNTCKFIVNDPSSTEDCWFVASNKEDGTHAVKIAPKGDQNKYQTFRVLSVLREPEFHSIVEGKEVKSLHFAHRCGRGKAKKQGAQCCINPFHNAVVDHKVNQDHKGCTYGCRHLCPHNPKCIFTWHDTGKVKPCFMADQLPVVCPHTPKCKHVIRDE